MIKMIEKKQSRTETTNYRKICIYKAGGPIGFYLRILLGDCQYDFTRSFVPDLLESFFACNPRISISRCRFVYLFF